MKKYEEAKMNLENFIDWFSPSENVKRQMTEYLNYFINHCEGLDKYEDFLEYLPFRTRIIVSDKYKNLKLLYEDLLSGKLKDCHGIKAERDVKEVFKKNNFYDEV